MISAKWWVATLAVAVPISAGIVAYSIDAAVPHASGLHASTKPALALTGRVVDAAKILDPSHVDQLTKLSERLEADTKVQLVVATTPSLNGSDIDRYSLTLANSWGLGDRVRNDGLLILVAPNERKVRIEVGKGLEQVLPNAACKKIVDDMVSLFRTTALGDGIMLGAVELDRAVRHPLVKAS